MMRLGRWLRKQMRGAIEGFIGWPLFSPYGGLVFTRVLRFMLLPIPLLVVVGVIILFWALDGRELIALGIGYGVLVALGRFCWPFSYLDPAARKVKRAFFASYYYRTVDTGSSGAENVEIAALDYGPYSAERLGVKVMPSPAAVDRLWLLGPLTRNSKAALLRTVGAAPNATILRIGDAACDGGVFKGSYALVDRDDSDVKELFATDCIAGNPPSPQEILERLPEETRKRSKSRSRQR